MRTKLALSCAVVTFSVMIAGCATSAAQPMGLPPTSGSDAYLIAPGAVVPEGVDVSEWRDVYGSSAIALSSVDAFATVDDLTAASELIVVARVVEQSPFPDSAMIATESWIEVTEVLKGDVADKRLRLYTIGSPTYLAHHSDVEGAGDPPLFEESYVMYLTKVTENMNSDGKLVPLDNVWRAVGSGHYLIDSRGALQWDGDAPESGGPTPTVTLTDVEMAVTSAGP